MPYASTHISIDDTTYALQRLSHNHYTSIYEDKFFRYLRCLHQWCNCKVTLYVFEHYGNWSLSDIPNTYRQEFQDAADWLKFGFHAVSEEQKQDNIIPDFEEQFLNVQREIIRFAGESSLAHILRLHYWFYPIVYVHVLKKHNVHTILMNEEQIVNENTINKWRTNIHIEKDILRNIIHKIMIISKLPPPRTHTHTHQP